MTLALRMRPRREPRVWGSGSPVSSPLKRPLMTTPDELGPCQRYCEELKQEIWRLDRHWAQLKADAADADRQGHGIDTVGFMRHLAQEQ